MSICVPYNLTIHIFLENILYNVRYIDNGFEKNISIYHKTNAVFYGGKYSTIFYHLREYIPFGSLAPLLLHLLLPIDLILPTPTKLNLFCPNLI